MTWATIILVLILVGFGVIQPIHASIKKKIWKTDGINVNITNAELSKPARSNLHCSSQCQGFSHCISWAFNAETGTCYLHPVLSAVGNGSNVRVYKDEAPTCQHTDAPTNLTLVTWNRTLTSLEADVTNMCYVQDNVYFQHLRCLATGQWETVNSGACKQRIWRNFTSFDGPTHLAVPASPTFGWSLCLSGTPIAEYRLGVDLLASNNDIVCEFDGRIVFGGFRNVTIINSRINGSWGTPMETKIELRNPSPPFPFAFNRTFSLKITAIEGNRLEMYVDGRHYATSKTLPVPLQSIVKVDFTSNTLHVDVLDLWCP